MNIRHAYRAGSFYEDSPGPCRRHVEKLFASAELPSKTPQKLYGGLVPHAGWVYSGAVAATTLKALNAAAPLKTVVMLGADHTGSAGLGEVYDSGIWQTPLGEVQIDSALAADLLAAGSCMRANPHAHLVEHSIEVQVPLLQVLNSSVQIVPIAVPPTGMAVEIGRVIGGVLAGRDGVAVVGSTDLTHHGGHFGNPGGHGEAGVIWAEANDRRMIRLIESMAADKIVPEAIANENACGSGAIAATVAACSEMGATKGLCLEYTNSYHVIRRMYSSETDDTTVGYASIVFA